MEFSRIGEHTIKCIISEDEIQNLGFSVEEIVTNSERTQEFMNYIFDLAEQEFETKFEMGVKTVQVEFRSDHTLSLTFSEYPAAEGMMAHLKDIVNGLINSIPQQKWEEIQKQRSRKKDSKDSAGGEEEPDIIVLLKFRDINSAIEFAKQVHVEPMPDSAFYKYRDEYYLMMDLSFCSEEQVRSLSVLTDEYAVQIEVGRQRLAYLTEHGKAIIAREAVEQLCEI